MKAAVLPVPLTLSRRKLFIAEEMRGVAPHDDDAFRPSIKRGGMNFYGGCGSSTGTFLKPIDLDVGNSSRASTLDAAWTHSSGRQILC